MKGLLVIVDGMGDLPVKQFSEMTPLEVAEMPNLDFLATRGEMGYMYPVRPGFVPESDEALCSIFGNEGISNVQGVLEAKGSNLNIIRGDLVLRVNFGTIDNLQKGNILDRRVGRTLTHAEAISLAKAINKVSIGNDFFFESTLQHRGILILKGGFSENILGNDYNYLKGRIVEFNKIVKVKSLDDDENSFYGVNLLNEFIEKAHGVLKNHPVNISRVKRGLLPANYLFVRSPAIEFPKLKQYRKWFAVNSYPLEKGFSKVSGMKSFSFDYPKFSGIDSYENFYDGLKKICTFAIKIIKKNHKKFDYGYVHIKETDFPGHDNKPLEKKEMLEYIDKTLFNFLRRFAPPHKIHIVVTSNTSTPCKLKNHSADFVPVLFYNDSIPRPRSIVNNLSPREGNEEKGIFEKFREKSQGKVSFVAGLYSKKKEFKGQKFCEREARKGNLGRIIGKDLLKEVGFVKQ